MISIKKAKKSDTAQLIKLFKEFSQYLTTLLPREYWALKRKKKPFDLYVKRELEEQISDRTGIFLVAEENKKIVAYCYGHIKKDPIKIFKRPKIGWFSKLAVTKKYRGRGISTLLKDELFGWFKKQGCKFVELEVLCDSEAVNIYDKWGFRRHIYRMRKKLK